MVCTHIFQHCTGEGYIHLSLSNPHSPVLLAGCHSIQLTKARFGGDTVSYVPTLWDVLYIPLIYQVDRKIIIILIRDIRGIVDILILSVRGPFLYVGICRLQTADSDV